MIALFGVLLLGAHPVIPADAEFKPWLTESGIAETRAQPAGMKFPFVRGSSDLDASCDAVKTALVDFDGYGKIFGGIVRKAKVLVKDDTSARVHFVWAYPWPFHDRDAIVAYKVEKQDGGGWVLSWQDDAQDGDPKTGVRIAHVEGATKMTPAGEKKCSVSYTYYGDLGIDFSKGMNEKILKTEPVKYFEAIRKGL